MNNPFGGDPPFRPPAPAGESDSQNLVEALLRRQALLLLQQRQQSQSQLSMLGLLSPTPIVFPSPSLLSAEQMLFRQQQEQIWQLQALALAKEREVLVQQQQVLEARQPAPQQTQPSVTTITRVVPKTRIVQSERSTAKLPDKVTTPEEAQKVLTILGTTQRAKSDPFIDASALPYLKVPPSVRGGIVQFFPERLYKLLEDMAAEGKESIVSFLPHGRAFMVYDVDQFVKEILPTYFGGQSKWGSFSRQLNLCTSCSCCALRCWRDPVILSHYRIDRRFSQSSSWEGRWSVLP